MAAGSTAVAWLLDHEAGRQCSAVSSPARNFRKLPADVILVDCGPTVRLGWKEGHLVARLADEFDQTASRKSSGRCARGDRSHDLGRRLHRPCGGVKYDPSRSLRFGRPNRSPRRPRNRAGRRFARCNSIRTADIPTARTSGDTVIPSRIRITEIARDIIHSASDPTDRTDRITVAIQGTPTIRTSTDRQFPSAPLRHYRWCRPLRFPAARRWRHFPLLHQ